MGLNRVRGKPFRISEIRSAAEALLAGRSIEDVPMPDDDGKTFSASGQGLA